MTTCRNGRCPNKGREYAYTLGRRRTWLCDPCHAALSAIGMSLTLIEQDTRTEWLKRLQPKVMDHGGSAA